MKIWKEIRFSTLICLIAYYGFAYWLPSSYSIWGGVIAKKIRTFLCRQIFKHCGKNINIERKAWFGAGCGIEIGDYSGIGINAHIPSDTIIGRYVMMGPNCLILDINHEVSDINKPMCFQGNTPRKQTIIEDDVWIGHSVSMTPGRHIRKGSIIAMHCVLTKDFPEYSIVGGNPSKLIKSRV